MDRWLSVNEIAMYLCVKRDTIYKWITRRGLPGHKIGRLWKFRKEEIDKQMREARKTAVLAQSLQNKLEAQKVIKTLERTRNTKRRDLFDAQDAIDVQREELIANIERQLGQQQTVRHLFTIRWKLE